MAMMVGGNTVSIRENNSSVGGGIESLQCQIARGRGVESVGGGGVEVGVDSKEEARRVCVDGVRVVTDVISVSY